MKQWATFFFFRCFHWDLKMTLTKHGDRIHWLGDWNEINDVWKWWKLFSRIQNNYNVHVNVIHANKMMKTLWVTKRKKKWRTQRCSLNHLISRKKGFPVCCVCVFLSYCKRFYHFKYHPMLVLSVRIGLVMSVTSGNGARATLACRTRRLKWTSGSYSYLYVFQMTLTLPFVHTLKCTFGAT